MHQMTIEQKSPSRSRRTLLALVLGVIGAALLVGGVQLLLLGGSPYYLVAGLLTGASAWFAWRGDRRAITIYLVMLGITLLWALWECGFDAWGLQSRLIAPAVRDIWVAFPPRRKPPPLVPAIGAAVIDTPAASMLYKANRNESVAPEAPIAANGSGEWLHYGNSLAGTRFAPLTQINAANVSGLEEAWTYRTGSTRMGMGFEATPLMVGDTLYLCTPENIVIALDPETGKRRWVVDPKVDAPPTGACRGVSYYRLPDATGPCAERVIFATIDARLMAVDARTGAACPAFGKGGTVDLKKGLGDVAKGYYYVSSAPTIVRGKVVLGGWVLDGQYVGEPSGVVRAFDAATGAFVWAWDMGRPGIHTEPGPGEQYTRGTPNSWGPMSGDEALGLVYAPTGNATPDYWGAHRSPESEKYTAALVALDIQTGEPRWHFQTVHHDVWDYDVSSQPTLVDVPIDGKTVPALVQATKRGEVFMLDRRTGKPLATVEERPVPQGPAKGDWLSKTQPFSVGMPSFDATVWTEKLMWGVTPVDQLWCRIKFRQARYEGPMTPPGTKPSITYPSYLGGVNWAGVSVDPERKLMVVNWSRMANYTRLVPRADAPNVKPSIDGGIHVGEPVPQIGTPFALFTGAFLSPLGVPCTEPPFGKIGVVDLQTRKMVWEKPLGTSKDSGLFDMPSHLPLPMGVPNTGGSVVTRSGLIFIAATQEKAIRAFDLKTGKQLWKSRLPAGGHATPMTYISPTSGRQFIVIAAGGSGPLHSGFSDHVIAYALPKK